MAENIRAFVRDAMEVDKAGLKVERARDLDSSEYPEELSAALADDPELEAVFGRLTPGRQRSYVLHFAAAKQSHARAARIRRRRPKIFAGKGFLDR